MKALHLTPPTDALNGTDETSAFLMGKALHRAFFSTARAAIEMTASSHWDRVADLKTALNAFDKLTGFKQPQVFDEFKCTIDGIILLMGSEEFMEDSELSWISQELSEGRADLRFERRKRYAQFETTFAALKRLIRSALSKRCHPRVGVGPVSRVGVCQGAGCGSRGVVRGRGRDHGGWLASCGFVDMAIEVEVKASRSRVSARLRDLTVWDSASLGPISISAILGIGSRPWS